jgi:hypothetical protein
MSIRRVLSRIFALATNGELDGLMPPFNLLTATLAAYPSGRPLETEENLRAFLQDDEAIRVALMGFAELIADLDLPLDSKDTPGLADHATNCREGALQWFADLRRFEAAHPHFKEELVRQSHLVSLATLEKLATAPPTAPGAGEKPNRLPPASPASGTAVCMMCGVPATTKWNDAPACAACKAEIEEFMAGMNGDIS